MKSWTNHATGAASIIALRGPAQLDTPTGRQLFLEAKGMMVRLVYFLNFYPHIQAMIAKSHPN